jgi:predicted RNA-binding Zn-ribbon protein involved in translation (DUF1610 family)
MKLVRRRELSGDDLESQLRRRLRDIDGEIARLTSDRKDLEARLKTMETQKSRSKSTKKKPARSTGVECPRCGRDRDFLTDADGYLAHVLEEPGDTEMLADGKPLFCPACGEVFLYAAPK